jgi:hypothetical protein
MATKQMSPKNTLNLYDAYKAVQMYAITMAVMSVGGVVATAGFDVFTADWITIFKDAFNVAFISTFSYLIKNFFTDGTKVY